MIGEDEFVQLDPTGGRARPEHHRGVRDEWRGPAVRARLSGPGAGAGPLRLQEPEVDSGDPPVHPQVVDWYGQRNWSKDGFVRTMTRIDVPAPAATLPAGTAAPRRHRLRLGPWHREGRVQHRRRPKLGHREPARSAARAGRLGALGGHVRACTWRDGRARLAGDGRARRPPGGDVQPGAAGRRGRLAPPDRDGRLTLIGNATNRQRGARTVNCSASTMLPSPAT